MRIRLSNGDISLLKKVELQWSLVGLLYMLLLDRLRMLSFDLLLAMQPFEPIECMIE